MMTTWQLLRRLEDEGCRGPGVFRCARVEIEIDGKRYEVRDTKPEGGYSTCPVLVLIAEAK